MKYSVEIVINLPVKRVVELFDNPENLKKAQVGDVVVLTFTEAIAMSLAEVPAE